MLKRESFPTCPEVSPLLHNNSNTAILSNGNIISRLQKYSDEIETLLTKVMVYDQNSRELMDSTSTINDRMSEFKDKDNIQPSDGINPEDRVLLYDREFNLKTRFPANDTIGSILHFPERSLFTDFNYSNMTNESDSEDFRPLIEKVERLNKNMEAWIGVLNNEVRPFLTKISTKFMIDHCDFKTDLMTNKYLIPLSSVDGKFFAIPENVLNVVFSCSLVKNGGFKFNENRKLFVETELANTSTTITPAYKTFWEKLTTAKALNILQQFSLPQKKIIIFQCNIIMDELRYLISLKDHLVNETSSVSSLFETSSNSTSTANVFLELDTVIGKFYNKITFHDENLTTSPNDDMKIFETSELARQLDIDIEEDVDSESRQMAKKRKCFDLSGEGDDDDDDDEDCDANDLLAHGDTPLVKLVKRMKCSNEQDFEENAIVKEKFEMYANIIEDLYKPFVSMLNTGTQFSMFTTDYDFLKTSNINNDSFSQFVDSLHNFTDIYNIVSLLFDPKVSKAYNETFLNDLCEDLAKSTFIVGKTLILTSTDMADQNVSESSYTLKEVMIDNPELFPLSMSIREATIISNYLAKVKRDPNLTMSSIATNFMYDSILLSPQVILTVYYIYGYFLKYLFYNLSSGSKAEGGLDFLGDLTNLKFPDSLSEENIFSQMRSSPNQSENFVNSSFTNNNFVRKSQYCPNIYLSVYTLLTGVGVGTIEESLDNDNQLTLISFVLMKIFDFVYRSFKVTNFCREAANMSNTIHNKELFNDLQKSGHMDIASANDFERYLTEFITAAKQVEASRSVYLFSVNSQYHETNWLLLAKEQVSNMAKIILPSTTTTVAELVSTRANFYNLNKNVLVILYTTSKKISSRYRSDYSDEDHIPKSGADIQSTSMSHNMLTFGAYGDKPTENPVFITTLPSSDYSLRFKNLTGRLSGSDIRLPDIEGFNENFIVPYNTTDWFLQNKRDDKKIIDKSDNDFAIRAKKSMMHSLALFDDLAQTSQMTSNSLAFTTEILISQKYLYLIENIALQMCIENPHLFLFNTLDLSHMTLKATAQANFTSYLAPILDTKTFTHINMFNVCKAIDTDDDLKRFFNQTSYLVRLRFFIMKRFKQIRSLDNYLFVFKPIQLNRVFPNFYLGVLIIFIWHTVFNPTIF